jgi:hypothetical protein
MAVPTVMLPAPDEMAMNLGVDVLDLRSGYVVWKRTRVPLTLTWMLVNGCRHQEDESAHIEVVQHHLRRDVKCRG